MNRRTLFAVVSLFLFVGMLIFSGCKKTNPTEPLEPISIVQPDSLIKYVFAPDTQAIQIKFTTDRPIDWILGVYDVDTLIDSANYVPTYPDTLFFQNLQTSSPRVNLYTYTGSYYLPANLQPFSAVRFKITFQAGDSYPVTGQNYPVGLVGASKQFVINVR